VICYGGVALKSVKNTLLAIILFSAVFVSCESPIDSNGGGNGNSGGKGTYTVRFNANGGLGDAPFSMKVKAGSSITLPQPSGLYPPTHDYVFGGWNTAASGAGETYPADSSFTPTGDTILYAKWAVTCYVTFDANDGTGWISSTPTTEGYTITLPDGSAYNRYGFIFDGWNTNASGTGTSYRGGDSYTVSGDITLYVKWLPAPGTETNPLPLTANIWVDGMVKYSYYIPNDADPSVWYSFDVVSGATYYVWWDDYYFYPSPSRKSLNANVSAYYSDTTSIFADIDNGWEYPQSFTADRTGTVLIKVSPSYRDGFGTFALVCSAGSARPVFYTVSYPDTQITVTAGNSVTITLPSESYPPMSGFAFVGWYTFISGVITDYSAGGTYTITPDSDILFLPKFELRVEAIPLTENMWTPGSIAVDDDNGDSYIYYSFDVEKGERYCIWWQDALNGYNGNYKTLDVDVYAQYSDGSSISSYETIYGGWPNPNFFTADRNGTILVRVSPTYSDTAGTFSIAYNTSGFRPPFVFFSANGGSGEVPYEQTVIDGFIILPDKGGLTMDGFYFGGWWLYLNEIYQPGDIFRTTDDTVLWAKWVPNPGTGGISLGIEQVIDGTPTQSIGPIVISRANIGNQRIYTATLDNPAYYDSGSIKWEIAGVGIYAGQTIVGTGSSFALNAGDVRYNSLGGHVLILTVAKDGRRYQRAIPFTIVR